MIEDSLDSSHQDKSNGSKYIMIGAIFAEIMHLNYFYKKFRVGSDRVNYLTRPGIFGLGQSGTRIIGSKFGALLVPVPMPVPVPNNHACACAHALNFLPQACAGFAEP